LPVVEQPLEKEVSVKPHEGVSPSIISKINEPETATEEVAGTEVKTDLAEIARIKKLEQDIESLKSQSETLQVQKYLIIILALAFLAALTMIIINNRRGRPTDKGHPSIAEINRHHQPAPEPEIKSDVTARKEQNADTIYSQRKERLFDATHGGYAGVISQAEHPAGLTNRFEAQVEDKPEPETNVADQNDDLPSPNTLLFESSNEKTDQDVNSIITTVDVYLAYRRLTEAESILHNSIDNHPELPELKAKLLEIYAFKKDEKLFRRYLERYQEELASKTPQLWDNILALAVTLIPNHPFVADITTNQNGESSITGTSSDTLSDNSNIDIDIDIEADADAMVDELVIGDIHTTEDELFKVDKEEQDSFDIDIDLDMDDINKS